MAEEKQSFCRMLFRDWDSTEQKRKVLKFARPRRVTATTYILQHDYYCTMTIATYRFAGYSILQRTTYY